MGRTLWGCKGAVGDVIDELGGYGRVRCGRYAVGCAAKTWDYIVYKAKGYMRLC